MPRRWRIPTAKESLLSVFPVKKNVYIRASTTAITLHIDGIIKIQATVKMVSWKRKSLVMTMMASSPSNVNIPAWSLFPLGQSHCSILKAPCECSKGSLDIFPLRWFICLYPGDVPTCHIKHFLRAKVKAIVTGAESVWASGEAGRRR